jgi:hypothetical protein
MKRDEIATQIYCALVARDPLPNWRFLEIKHRLQEMADLAVLMAYALETRLEETEADISARFAEKWDRARAEFTPGPMARKAEQEMANRAREEVFDKRKRAKLPPSLFEE